MSALKKMVLLLTAVAVSVPLWAKVELEYFYADDGTLIGRAVNGVRHNFVYDKRGQLLAVKDARGNDIERYVYDPAGNILSKTVGGVTTKYTYDKTNQLLTSTRNGKVTKYEYDAAGRLIREGDKVYFYGYQDKILTVTVNGKKELTFDYHMDGQLASAGGNGKSEEFLWDGLALIKRGNTRYVNEPYVTGGNPVIAGNDVMFNDMLGSTVAINDKAVGMTSFGETTESKAMYTGKPYVDGLGYAFLFRNYRTDLGKWQTVDPLGYPDGWNSLAYCRNRALSAFDPNGLMVTCLDDYFNLAAMLTTYFEYDIIRRSSFSSFGMGFNVLKPQNVVWQSKIYYNIDDENKSAVLIPSLGTYFNSTYTLKHKGTLADDGDFDITCTVASSYSLSEPTITQVNGIWVKNYNVLASYAYNFVTKPANPRVVKRIDVYAPSNPLTYVVGVIRVQE